MNDQLFCVDESCDLSEKLISTWIHFLKHQELEHKMLTIKQFKSYLIEKQSLDGPQHKDQKKNQYFSQAQEKLNLLFDQIETRIQQLVKQEIQEIYYLCLKDLEKQIENCIVKDVIYLDNFETFFQFEEFQIKCLNFYNNNIQKQMQDIIDQFCRQKETQFEDIFRSLKQSFFHKKQMLQQVEEPAIRPQIQQQIKENQDDLQPLKGYKQTEKIKYDYFQNQESTQESKPDSLLPLQGYKQIDQIQYDYYQYKEYTQESKPDSLQGYKQIDQIKQDQFQYRENAQESQQDSLLPLKGYKQIDQIQQDYFQYKQQTQEFKPESTVKINQQQFQDPKSQINNQKPKKKLNIIKTKNQVSQIQQTQNQIPENVKEVKIPQFKQINGKLEHFTPQLQSGVVQLLDNFKTAKSQSGFILFDGFIKKSANIKLEILILEFDNQQEIEIGLIDWSTFIYPRKIGKPQKGIYSLNNKGSKFKDGNQKNKDKIFKHQTKLKINITNKQLQFIGEKTTGFDISSLNGDLSLFAYLQNAQIQIIS